jgi:hypothetical protein
MMAFQYNTEQHRAYLHMINTISQHWLRVFDHNTDFYSAVYWDLLTRLWQAKKPVRRTDALKCMTAVKSAATAGKYLNAAIRQRLLQEYPNPQDARSKVLELSPDVRARLDTFFDHAVEEVRQANQEISHQGPVPDLG